MQGSTTLCEYLTFCSLPENQEKTFELVDGYIIMMAGNTTFDHQRISGHIYRKIGNYLEGKKCEVFQEMKVHLFSGDINDCTHTFQPDIMVICDRDKAKNTAYEGAPEFIVEVVSKSSVYMDYYAFRFHPSEILPVASVQRKRNAIMSGILDWYSINSKKCAAYMKYGVKEYWVVDPFKQLIHVYINDGSGTPVIYRYTFDDSVKVTVLDELSIDFKEIVRIL
jgi:Uma2 family endonuclease